MVFRPQENTFIVLGLANRKKYVFQFISKIKYKVCQCIPTIPIFPLSYQFSILSSRHLQLTDGEQKLGQGRALTCCMLNSIHAC